jgi:hypothetical protein
MIELESYVAPIPVLHGSNGAQHRGTGKTAPSGSPTRKSSKNLRRHSPRKRGSWFVSLLAHLS